MGRSKLGADSGEGTESSFRLGAAEDREGCMLTLMSFLGDYPGYEIWYCLISEKWRLQDCTRLDCGTRVRRKEEEQETLLEVSLPALVCSSF